MYFYHVNVDVSVLSIYDGTVGLQSFGTRLGRYKLAYLQVKKGMDQCGNKIGLY